MDHKLKLGRYGFCYIKLKQQQQQHKQETFSVVFSQSHCPVAAASSVLTMAPQRHQKDKLVEVGIEGFALLDEFYGRPKKSYASGGNLVPAAATATAHQVASYDPHRQYQTHTHQFNYYNHQYRGPQAITIREPVIDSNQAAQFYGGRGIVDHSFRKPTHRAY